MLGRTIRDEDRLSIFSDFSEIFEELAREQGYLTACRWYRAQVVRSIPLLILNDLWWGGIMFKSYLKIALRNLKKHKGYSFINIVGLAVGLTSFLAEQKTKEIAIRKVLGAKTTGIVVRFSKEIVVLVFLANSVAWPVAAYFMNGWIKTFAYRTNIGIVVFITAAIIALAIALLTVAFQSIKAATANPVNSLRYE